MVAAVAAAAGLVWFEYFRAQWNPPVGTAEFFWVRILVAFGAYALLQQWTLAYETGRGDELIASLDKFISLLPLAAVVLPEVYWLGKESPQYLSWRHHSVGTLWALYSLADYFATDITNQRLRALQFAPAREA